MQTEPQGAGAPPTRFTIAHLSDLHLGPLRGFTPRHWGVKRGLGYLNWQRGRHALHRADVVAGLVSDLKQQHPDHIAVTGDLVNIGLPAELEAAADWLEDLGDPNDVTVIPGNHDIYVRLHSDPGIARWSAYMRDDPPGGDASTNKADEPLRFPFVRRMGPLAIVGVNSAEPTPPFVAAGRVPEAELERLASILRELKGEGLCRVVIIHHPPLPGQAPPLRALRNAQEVMGVLRSEGAEIVLHGHNHTDTLEYLERDAGADVPVIGIASASAGKAHKGRPLARYNLLTFSFTSASGDPQIELIGRGLARPGGPVVELERCRIDGPAARSECDVING